MDFFAQTILPYVLLYKYWALLFITFLSSLAIPIPAGTLLVASSAFASQGYFNFYLVLLVVIIANIVGDNICYWIARKYGKQVFDYFSFTRKVVESKNFKLIEAKLRQRPGFVIFISRFEAIATLSVNAICGLSKVPYKKFLLFEAIGAVGDAVLYGMIGFLFGDSWEAVNNLIGNFSIIVLIVLIGCVILFWKRIMKNLDTEHLMQNN
ncbi:MAG TPA: DedA family protein [Candidatus Paceibacterota bacterium]|jgi:membrane-associated protein|nr:DedA family protein [Candidatus Paceibacterota bacterium]